MTSNSSTTHRKQTNSPVSEKLTLKEACAYAACSESTLYRRMKAGILTPTRNGGGRKLYFDRADLDALFQPDAGSDEERIRTIAKAIAAKAPKLTPDQEARLRGLLS